MTGEQRRLAAIGSIRPPRFIARRSVRRFSSAVADMVAPSLTGNIAIARCNLALEYEKDGQPWCIVVVQAASGSIAIDRTESVGRDLPALRYRHGSARRNHYLAVPTGSIRCSYGVPGNMA
jgi:hypothetical protein